MDTWTIFRLILIFSCVGTITIYASDEDSDVEVEIKDDEVGTEDKEEAKADDEPGATQEDEDEDEDKPEDKPEDDTSESQADNHGSKDNAKNGAKPVGGGHKTSKPRQGPTLPHGVSGPKRRVYTITSNFIDGSSIVSKAENVSPLAVQQHIHQLRIFLNRLITGQTANGQVIRTRFGPPTIPNRYPIAYPIFRQPFAPRPRAMLPRRPMVFQRNG